MKLYLQSIARVLSVLLLFMAMACSEDDKSTDPNGDDNDPVNYKNKLSAKFSGDYSGTFTPIFIQTSEYDDEATMTGNSGKEFLTIIIDTDFTVGTQPRFRGNLTIVANTALEDYGFKSGTFAVNKDNDDIIQGTFAFEASNSGKTKSISITEGSFTYVKKKD